jgi:hypothetical protein
VGAPVKTFKFGQLVSKEDICDRRDEIKLLTKVCESNGRAIVYGPRRFGKTSVVKNVVLEDFLEEDRKSLAVYADFFQLESSEDAVLRLRVALEQALSQRAKVKTLLASLQNYLKNFRIEISSDPLSGAPTVSLAGQLTKEESSLSELFLALKNLSKDYRTLLVLDEFQDIVLVEGLEAKLRSEIQNLNRTAVILLGSKKHLLREVFHEESRPFYGFGIDIEFKAIAVTEWVPYIQERFATYKLSIKEEGVVEICRLMRNVPNAIQELCQWIALQGETGVLDTARIHQSLARLIENKSSRYMERMASLSAKEKMVLIAVARQEPVSSIASTAFLQATQVSATATKATILRLTDQGVLDDSDEGYSITDPLFRLFLVRQFGDK